MFPRLSPLLALKVTNHRLTMHMDSPSHREATKEVDTEEAAVVDTQEVVEITSIIARAPVQIPDTTAVEAADSRAPERILSASMSTSTRLPSAGTSRPMALAVSQITANSLMVRAN